MGPRRFPKIIKATKKSAPVDALEKTKIPTGVLEKPVSAEETAALEKLSDLSFLESQGIKPGSMAQLQFPETFASTIADADLADWATKLGRKLRLDSLTKQTPELPDQSRRTKILTREEMRKKREEDAAIQQVKERKQKEFEEGKTEGARDIDLSKLRAAGVAGAAIGTGMLGSAPLARADEGSTVSQSNPEFNSSSTTSKVLKNAVSEAEKKYGTYDLAGGFQKTLEGIDKYTGRPMRAAALSALKGESPITGAIQSVSEDKDVEGREVARKFLEKAEEHGMRLRAPVDPKLEQLRQLGVEIEGKKPEEYLPSNDFAAEAPVGLAADMILDPTNVVGMGLGTKAGKGFSKVLGLIK
jgi:hypothetical protein